MTLPAIYWSLSELTSLLNKSDALNQIIKCLNLIISENKPYNLRLCTFTFQLESLKVNWNKNQDSSMAERQARDLEVRVRIPVQAQIFLLKFMKSIILGHLKDQTQYEIKVYLKM